MTVVLICALAFLLGVLVGLVVDDAVDDVWTAFRNSRGR